VARSLSLSQVGWALAIFATLLFSIAPPLVRFALLDGFDTAMLLLVRLWIRCSNLWVDPGDHRPSAAAAAAAWGGGRNVGWGSMPWE
jgi:hypothetical protein